MFTLVSETFYLDEEKQMHSFIPQKKFSRQMSSNFVSILFANKIMIGCDWSSLKIGKKCKQKKTSSMQNHKDEE